MVVFLRSLAAAVAVFMLSGCIFFPPFFPGEPFGEIELSVDNASSEDLVVRFIGTDAFPAEFAVPAGGGGTAALLAMERPTAAALLTPDCEIIAEVVLPADALGVTIGADGSSLEVATEPPAADQRLVEFWDCASGPFGPVEVDPAGVGAAAGAMVVSSADGYLWLIDVEAGTARQLTDDEASDTEARLSPDGSAVAFSRFAWDSGGPSVWTVPTAGGEADLVRDEAMTPAWSPDGRRLAMLDSDPFGSGGVVVLDLESGVEEAFPGEMGAYLDWSPAGDRLAFSALSASFDPFGGDESPIYVVDLASMEITELARAAFSGPITFSPDGSMLLADTYDGFTAVSRILVLDADTGVVVADVGGEQVFSSAAWSPDGSRIAYASDESFGSGSRLMSAAAAGGDEIEVVRLSAEEGFITGPAAWSTDGASIAYVMADVAGGSEIWVVAASGGEPVRLATAAVLIEDWR